MTVSSSLQAISQIRADLRINKLDGFILPRGDEFLGEYVAPYAERLAWLTGFTGSAGLAVLLQDAGAVFSDGRYTEQLRTQLDPEIWTTHSSAPQGLLRWLASSKNDLTLGYDPRLTSSGLLETLRTASNATLVAMAHNPIDAVWVDQPARPTGVIQLLGNEFHGLDSSSKRQEIALQLQETGADALLITDPTAVAWLLNIRGNDVPYTPVALAFAIILKDGRTTAFIDPARLPEGTAAHVGPGVTFVKQDSLPDVLKQLAGKVVIIDPKSTALWFMTALEAVRARLMQCPDPCQIRKATKNAVELGGARRVQLIDSAALCRFLHHVEVSGAGQHETELADKLNDFRAQSVEYREESFPAISASGPNAALPHYRALPGQDRVLQQNEIFLIDSGGQYRAGTTDVTRTVWIGPDAPPDDIRDAFTRVLKGHIALARARFPVGTPGYRLDPLARYALWQSGLDYDHGTGHGVGSYLSVHEGPQNIGMATKSTPLLAGMIVSIEPGYYAPGRYGIRCENLVAVRPASLSSERAFLEFETLNFAPFDQKLISITQLTDDECAWLDHYHAKTREVIAPLLAGEALAWLIEACAPIKKPT